MTAKNCVVCLDVGGTFLKSALVLENGSIVNESFQKSPVDSQGSAETIFTAFADSLSSGLEFAKNAELPVAGIGVSTCGPFDLKKGISFIKGLDKYESIYGLNVRETLQNMLHLPAKLPFLFDADSWSFARGEAWYGAGKQFKRIIAFTMGTGVGSAFVVDGKVVTDGPGVPPLGWISGQKYKDGIVNDYMSRTFMINRYRELTGEKIEIDEMAKRAFSEEKVAKKVFKEVGSFLGNFLKGHHVKDFRTECIIFGGQISKSYGLFIEPIKEALKDIATLKAILPAADINYSALKGVAKFVFEELRTSDNADKPNPSNNNLSIKD